MHIKTVTIQELMGHPFAIADLDWSRARYLLTSGFEIFVRVSGKLKSVSIPG